MMELATGRQWSGSESERMTMLRKGTRLAKILIEEYDRATANKDDVCARVWKLLADLWTEVVVCATPATSELHVKAHKEALAHDGEFITMLWALATHTGITRRPSSGAAAARTCLIISS